MAPVPKSQRKGLQLQCEYGACTEVLVSSQKLTNHIMDHAEEFIAGTLTLAQCLAEVDHNNTDEFQCQWVDCGYVTSEGSGALLRHLLFHGYHTRIKWMGDVERERCNVEKCQLEAHSRNIIPEVPSSFVCSWGDCEFITNNPDYFYCHVEMHSQMAEADNGMFACRWTECQVKTKDKYKLRDHLRCHSQEKKYGCIQCGGLFSNRTKFFDHIHRQGILDEPNYQCSHCSKVFASERLLRDHMRHHVNHYKCPFCDMTCPAPSVLKKHIQWRHTSERPFACELCDHRAKTRTDMRRHMESHNAEDAYQCDIVTCDFTSKSLNALRCHFRKTHSDIEESRYMCHVCSRKFTRGFRLTVHLKKVHSFKWPSGHVRFRYKEHEDGYLRLQTVRYESIELTQQILQLDNSSQPLPSISEEGGGAAQPVSQHGGEGAESRTESGPTRKETSTARDSLELAISQGSGGPPINQVEYVENGVTHVIVVNGGDQLPSMKVYNPMTLNKTPSRREKNKRAASKRSPGSRRNRDRASPVAESPHRTVSVESGGQPISRKRILYDDAAALPTTAIHHSDTSTSSDVPVIDRVGQTQCVSRKRIRYDEPPAIAATASTIHESQDDDCSSVSHDDDDSRSPTMGVFPIEQLQCLNDSASDRESLGQQTPQKAQPGVPTTMTTIIVVPEASVVHEAGVSYPTVIPGGDGAVASATTDDERMRTLYNRLEDDRMAVAVEAMTNLSRGVGNEFTGMPL